MDIDHQSRIPSTEREKEKLCVNIITDSINQILRNKNTYFVIFIVLCFPLSQILIFLNLLSTPTKQKIYHLQSVAVLAATSFESRHVWKEARDSSLSLFHLKLVFFLPSCLLSLLVATTCVHVTSSLYTENTGSFKTAISNLKLTWKRSLITSLCNYAVLLVYSALAGGFLEGYARKTGFMSMRLVVWFLVHGVEIYLMGCLGLAMVVAVLEERWGLDAIMTASGLMQGRKLFGWVLSCSLTLVTAVIGWRLEHLAVGDASKQNKWSDRVLEEMGLAAAHGVLMLIGHVFLTMFYWDRIRVHVTKYEIGF